MLKKMARNFNLMDLQFVETAVTFLVVLLSLIGIILANSTVILIGVILSAFNVSMQLGMYATAYFEKLRNLAEEEEDSDMALEDE